MTFIQDQGPYTLANAPAPQDSFEPRLDPGLAVEHPALLAALEHYLSLVAGRDMPQWSDFSPRKAPPAMLPHCLLLDVTPDDPLQYRWRLMGTHVYETLNRDTTGKTFQDLYEGTGLERMKVAPHWVIEHRRPLRAITCGSFNKQGLVPSENLFLPFSDGNGRVARIMYVIAFQPPEPV